MNITIDNPGQGNCAFYSYAIALIDIIKHEFAKNNESKIFKIWQHYSPQIAEHEKDILGFDNHKQDIKLLDNLQQSLRHVVYQKQYEDIEENLQEIIKKVNDYNSGKKTKSDLKKEIKKEIINNEIYQKFAEIFYANYHKKPVDPNYNGLAKSSKIISLVQGLVARLSRLSRWTKGAESEVKENFIDQQILDAFSKDVFGGKSLELSFKNINPDSVIMQGLKEVEQNYRWGTHQDLNILSQAFDVNFHYFTNGKAPYTFQDIKGKPVVTINNVNNAHWNTVINTSNTASNSSTKKYTTYASQSLLSKAEIRAIFQNYVGGFYSLFGRNHTAMAKRIVAACDNKEETVASIVLMIKEYVNNQQISFEKTSSFRKRAEHIFSRNEYYNGFAEQNSLSPG